MKNTHQLAKHLREVHFGDSWTWSSLKEQLEGITWKEATQKVNDFNTIAVLTYHSAYYVTALIAVLEEKTLNTKDVDSFQHPPINSQKDWEALLDTVWKNAEHAATLLEQLPDSKLYEIFRNEKYGIYFRNILGMIEHMYYHVGQISIIKRLVVRSS